MQLDQIIDEFTAYLKHEVEEGRGRVALDPDAIAALRGHAPAPPQPTATPQPPPQPAPAAAAPVTEPMPPTPAAPAAQPTTKPVSDPLQGIARRIAACTDCGLCDTRTKTVPGQGSAHPDIAFIGEGPGYDEDQQGLAFVGEAGQLLTKMMDAMGYSRDEVWIGNIVKCRPPDNRTPADPEMQSCLPYLRAQLELLQPKVIVCLGATAVKGLLTTTEDITQMRGQWQSFEDIDVMPTFHPTYLLRNPAAKREAWNDLKAVLERLGRSVPPKG